MGLCGGKQDSGRPRFRTRNESKEESVGARFSNTLAATCPEQAEMRPAFRCVAVALALWSS
eukprot:3514224-Amphidinium_carterae.1